MRIVFASLASLIGGLLAVPVVLAGGDNPALGYAACTEVAAILETIRTLESGGDYTAQAGGSSASGAYQYIDSTWRTWLTASGLPGDYPRAYLAPPDVQDQVAAANVRDILDRYENRIETVPVIWYYPAALGNDTLMDLVPAAAAGNTLTVRQYQQRWMNLYQQVLDGRVDTDGQPAGCTPSVTADGEWALPLPRSIIDADPSMLHQPHHDYPAIDLMVPEGTPVYAITSGTVVTIQRWDGNWWTAGCGRPGAPPGCKTCGNGITIEKADGLRHTYCHLRTIAIAITDGAPIVAGQQLGTSGNTGRSGAPHVHLELRVDGRQICPHPILQQIRAGTVLAAPSGHPVCFLRVGFTASVAMSVNLHGGGM